MAYTLPNWTDTPSTATPQSAANLAQLNTAINGATTGLDARVATLEAGGVGVGAVTAADSTIIVAGPSSSRTVAVNAIAESKVTNLVADLAAKASAASPTFTGTVTLAKSVSTPVTLTDGATISTDASLGNVFKVTIAGTGRTLANPTNLSNGQRLLYRVKQDASGFRTITTYGTLFRFSTALPQPTLSTAANKTDYLGFLYDSTDNKLDFIGFAAGY